MILPIIGRLSWKSFWAGTAVATFGGALARPLLVSTVRAGYGVVDAANGVWNDAKAEAQSVKHEALSGGSASEIQQLRDEVAALRAQLAKKA
jgi:hypothetical protein